MSHFRVNFELVLLGIIAGFLSFLIFAPYQKVPFTRNTRAEVPESMPTIVPSPTPTSAPTTQTYFVDSSDGMYTLIMNQLKSSKINSFNFIVENKTNNFQHTIFSKSNSLDQNMVLPENSWSPQDSHVFVQENSSSEVNYYVLSASPDSPSDDTYINLTQLFMNQYFDYSIQEVTGWLSESTLIINSIKNTGEVGPSFWFNVQNQSFGQFGVHYG